MDQAPRRAAGLLESKDVADPARLPTHLLAHCHPAADHPRPDLALACLSVLCRGPALARLPGAPPPRPTVPTNVHPPREPTP